VCALLPCGCLRCTWRSGCPLGRGWGGSGNAATALWAANQMTGGTVGERELQEWSGEIGSDIPFFFSHGRRTAREGERWGCPLLAPCGGNQPGSKAGPCDHVTT